MAGAGGFPYPSKRREPIPRSDVWEQNRLGGRGYGVVVVFEGAKGIVDSGGPSPFIAVLAHGLLMGVGLVLSNVADFDESLEEVGGVAGAALVAEGDGCVAFAGVS